MASARVEKPIRALKRSGDLLITGGEDQLVSLWDINTLELKDAKQGHSDSVDFCTVIPGTSSGKPTLLSIVTGNQPEVLRTDLAKFRQEFEVVNIGDLEDDENSPLSRYESALSGNQAIANKSGLAYAEKDGEAIEWEVAAWQKHVLSDKFLFAQTRRDQFLKYNRETGEIESVLRRLSQLGGNNPHRIVKFQVSRDGKIGLVEVKPLDDNQPRPKEFQIWDLENQVEIKRIRYGQVFRDFLPTVKLSPNGKFLIAGKLGFAVWTTAPGDDMPIYSKLGANRDEQWPKLPLNNFVFCDGGDEFAVSWPEAASNRDSKSKTGRIHLYVRNGRSVELKGRFRVGITQGVFDTNLRAYEPNTFDARVINNERYVLARTVDGIDLLKLRPGVADPVYPTQEWDAFEIVNSFTDANYAQFSDIKNDVLVLNKSRLNAVQRWSMDREEIELLQVAKRLEASFPTIRAVTSTQSEKTISD